MISKALSASLIMNVAILVLAHLWKVSLRRDKGNGHERRT